MYLCQVAAAARCAGAYPLVMTLEMSPPEIGPPDRRPVLRGELRPDPGRFAVLRRIPSPRHRQDELRDMGSIFIEQPPRGERTVKHLTSRARQLDASILIIDQLSFMEGDREYTGERAMTARHGDVIFAPSKTTSTRPLPEGFLPDRRPAQPRQRPGPLLGRAGFTEQFRALFPHRADR